MEAIAFSGGKDSMKMIQILKDKKPRPILVTYLPDNDTAGLRPLFEYFSDTEGWHHEFLFGKEEGHFEHWTLEPNGDVWLAVGYSSNILSRVRKNLSQIKVYYVGRKKVDLYDRGLVPRNVDIEIKFRTRPKVVFPVWSDP